MEDIFDTLINLQVYGDKKWWQTNVTCQINISHKSLRRDHRNQWISTYMSNLYKLDIVISEYQYSKSYNKSEFDP